MINQQIWTQTTWWASMTMRAVALATPSLTLSTNNRALSERHPKKYKNKRLLQKSLRPRRGLLSSQSLRSGVLSKALSRMGPLTSRTCLRRGASSAGWKSSTTSVQAWSCKLLSRMTPNLGAYSQWSSKKRLKRWWKCSINANHGTISETRMKNLSKTTTLPSSETPATGTVGK